MYVISNTPGAQIYSDSVFKKTKTRQWVCDAHADRRVKPSIMHTCTLISRFHNFTIVCCRWSMCTIAFLLFFQGGRVKTNDQKKPTFKFLKIHVINILYIYCTLYTMYCRFRALFENMTIYCMATRKQYLELSMGGHCLPSCPGLSLGAPLKCSHRNFALLEVSSIKDKLPCPSHEEICHWCETEQLGLWLMSMHVHVCNSDTFVCNKNNFSTLENSI